MWTWILLKDQNSSFATCYKSNLVSSGFVLGDLGV